jgi:predicted DNA-binding protein with PD1-like motif
MQLFRGGTAVEVIAVRVDAGEDLLASLNQVVNETQIAAGAIVSGTGNLEHMHLEVPANLMWPPTVFAVEKSGPGLIISAQGHIANGYPELYLTVARRNELHSGKVMSGTRVLHFAEFSILRVGNTRWTRTPHPQTGVPLLQASVPPNAQGPAVMLMGRPVDPAAIALVPKALLQKHGCLPVARSGDTLVVAMTDPSNPFAIDDLRAATGLRIQAVAVPAPELMPALQQVLATR